MEFEMNRIEIDDWKIACSGDDKEINLYIKGETNESNISISLNTIININGRNFTDEFGKEFTLGTISEEFEKYTKEHWKIPLACEDPIIQAINDVNYLNSLRL